MNMTEIFALLCAHYDMIAWQTGDESKARASVELHWAALNPDWNRFSVWNPFAFNGGASL